MKACVIGLGSMGKRRIRLLKKIDLIEEIVGVDSSGSRQLEVSHDFNIKCFSSLREALKSTKLDVAVICTPPLTHANIILDCLNNDLHVFTEINLVNDRYDEIIKLSKDKNKVLFLSSTFLYRKEIETIKEKVDGEIVNYSYHVGQYLPDWHPWENYTDFFVADKKSNGCRELFAIELPWIIDCFGNIKDYRIVKKKTTDLNINYDDTYMVLLEHKNGSFGSLIIDVVSRVAERNLTIFNEDIFIKWSGRPETLQQYSVQEKEMQDIETYVETTHDTNYASNIIEDAYLEELVCFFKVIVDGKKPRYTFEKDKEILNLINSFEE